MYDSTLIDTPAPNNIYTVEHGRLVAFPLTITEGQAVRIVTAHLAVGIQDHSLRVWVSSDIGGISVARGANEFWHPNRNAQETVAVYDRSMVAPDENGIAVEPGTYYVNVLNLINSRNAFSFVLTNLE